MLHRPAPALVAAAVLATYLAWVGLFVARGHAATAFVHIGSRFAGRSFASPVIRDSLRGAGVTDTGYDGQFVYYIALDPGAAHFYMDAPAYRYTRILYPMSARLLALGTPGLVPYALLALNLAALAGGVWAIAAYLRRGGVSVWWALVYGFYPGLFNAFQSDLTEVLAYGLVAIAIYLFHFGGRHRIVSSGLVFGVAVLTRETTAVFAAIYAAALLAPAPRAEGSGWRGAGTLTGLSLLPFLAYKIFLFVWLGSSGLNAEFALRPFAGLLSFAPFEPREWIEVVGVVAPAMVCAGAGAILIARRRASPEAAALIVNLLLFVVLLGRASYFSYYDSARVSTGVVLAALLSLPVFVNRRWMWISASLWFVVVPAGLLAPHLFHVFKL